MDAGQAKRWIRGRQAGERAVLAESRRRSAGSGRDSARTALGLIKLLGIQFGWPIPEDAITRQEDRQMYADWQTLRQKFGGQ